MSDPGQVSIVAGGPCDTPDLGPVKIDDSLKRPAEVDLLVGDARKAERELGWRPTTSFEQLIRLMVRSDLALLGS